MRVWRRYAHTHTHTRALGAFSATRSERSHGAQLPVQKWFMRKSMLHKFPYAPLRQSDCKKRDLLLNASTWPTRNHFSFLTPPPYPHTHMQLHAQRMCLHTYICTYILLSSYLGHYLPSNVLQLCLQRRRGLRRHLCHQRGGAKQWQLPLRAARHLQVHVQNRHHLVPLRRSTLRDEVWLLDLRWLSGECSSRSSNSSAYRTRVVW